MDLKVGCCFCCFGLFSVWAIKQDIVKMQVYKWNSQKTLFSQDKKIISLEVADLEEFAHIQQGA